MISFKRKTAPPPAPAGPETTLLSSARTCLQVINEACTRGRRYTLTAGNGTDTFTILVDGGGPCNASGGGLTGSAALAAAARLSSGTCVMEEGWSVAQPLYQIGLDMTLRDLLTGTQQPERGLPTPRGVEGLRPAAPIPPAAAPLTPTSPPEQASAPPPIAP